MRARGEWDGSKERNRPRPNSLARNFAALSRVLYKTAVNPRYETTNVCVRPQGLFPRRRQLILTDGPHLYYVDAAAMVLKGEIPW